MKKILAICSLIILYSCSDGTTKPTENKAKESMLKQKMEQPPSDLALQEWMQGKVWTAEKSMAPMAFMKLKAGGVVQYKTGKDGTWKIINGEYVDPHLTEWPVEKVDDKTFRLYVKPSDTWYVYKHTEDL